MITPAARQSSTRAPARFATAVSLLAAAAISSLTLRAQIRGAAATRHGTILTWGSEVTEWTNGHARVLRRNVNFGEGGCAAPGALIAAESPGRSAMIRLPLEGEGSPEVIEPDTEFSDCLWTRLLGHAGVLVAHRYSQVRFYEPGATTPWPYQEIYSIYTASQQGGLLESDVDEDGFPDLYVGNYWMKSPAAFELPWRIFAINLYHETETAALARLALFGSKDLIWAARTGERVTWFERPANVRDQWIPHPLDLGLDHVSGLAVDGGTVFAADAVRVVRWRNGTVTELAAGFRTLQLFVIQGELWSVTPGGVRRVPQRRK